MRSVSDGDSAVVLAVEDFVDASTCANTLVNGLPNWAERVVTFWDMVFFSVARSLAVMTSMRKKCFTASSCWFSFFAGCGFVIGFRAAAATRCCSDVVRVGVLLSGCCAESDCVAAVGFEVLIVVSVLALLAVLSEHGEV